MPKKSKKGQNDEDECAPPPKLTLASFLDVKSRQKLNVEKDKPNKQPAKTNETEKLKKNLPLFEDEKDPCVPQKEDEEVIYFVRRTKKGGIPISVENRSSGKKVTVISNVCGDGKSLVQILKNKLGTGGIFSENQIELQGDLLNRVNKFFKENKSLLRPYK